MDKNSKKYDLVVIGSGPGGEVGAIRAAQLGLKVALVEKNEHLGGTCLNVGCIPTKCLLESAKTWSLLGKLEKLGFSSQNPLFHWDKIQSRKEGIVDAQRKGLRFLMKKNKIDVLQGVGSFVNSQTIEVKGKDACILETKHTLLATGSRVKELGFAKSNGKNILSSDSILSIDHIPKTLAVVGGGVVGMEFASLFSRFGTEVTVIELLPQILPLEDGETVAELSRILRKGSIKIECGKKLVAVTDLGNKCLVKVEGLEDRHFDKVLMSAGREPVTQDLNLKNTKVQTDGPFITVDSHYRSNDPKIFAIGDIIKTPALAHTASAEAKHAVEIISGKSLTPINYETNPSAIYTYPEIASIGLTEEKLKEKSIPYQVAKFPFAPMAKAKIEEATDGFVKILYDPKYEELLGVHIVGAKATELIAEFVLGKLLEATVHEFGLAIHPHPTLSETVMEAAHVAEDGPIHM